LIDRIIYGAKETINNNCNPLLEYSNKISFIKYNLNHSVFNEFLCSILYYKLFFNKIWNSHKLHNITEKRFS
jgi:hypothetical protein